MEEKSKVEPKPRTKSKEKTTRITARIEEEKLKALEKIFQKKYPQEKNTTTNLLKKSIDFFLLHNQNIKTNNEIENIQNEISAIKNELEKEKINPLDDKIFKNLQKNFNLKFSKEEIFFIIKHIFQDEILQIKNENLEKHTNQIFFFLTREKEFFIKTKIFIMKNLKVKHQLKPSLYKILYKKIYNELPNSEEDLKKFYSKYVRDIIFLERKLKIALRKSIFEQDKNYENLKIAIDEISPKISQIKKYIDSLLTILRKCNEKN